MQPIFYLIAGLAIGSIVGYLLNRLSVLKNYVSKAEHAALVTENMQLKLENANRISKDDLTQMYVHKEIKDVTDKALQQASEGLREAEEKIQKNQQTIVDLTGQVAERMTKEELAKLYAPLDSFNLLKEKLKAADETLASNAMEILRLNNELTELRESEKFLKEKAESFKKELEEMHRLSHEQFQNMAGKIMDERQQAFIVTNKKELNSLLEPFQVRLDDFRKKVEDTRKEDIAELTTLKNEIGSLEKLNVQLSEDAKNLATALKADVKIQGNWGEDRLSIILEAEGLQKYIDFTREEQYRDDEQNRARKPDYILRLPNGKHIIIDSKVSLTAYANYFNADTPEEKAEFLRQHLKSVTDHINSLADKNYQSLAGLNSPDYVFLFMPIESALTLAMNQNRDIFTHALHRKIVLITPTTLVATLKVVRLLWQKENQVKNVEEIFKECGALYDKFVDFLGDLSNIEQALQNATASYNAAYYKLKSGERKGYTIIGRFETIRKLEAKTTKLIAAHHISDFDLRDETLTVLPVDKNDEPEEKNDTP